MASTTTSGRHGERLREHDERFRSAFEHAAIGMAVVSPEGQALEVNPALAAMLGYTPEELLERSWQGVTHPDDCEATREAAERVLRGEASSYHLEKRYLHKDGRVLWGSIRGAPVRAPDGTPLCLVVQIQDITRRKQAEEALRASEARYRGILDSQAALIFRSGRDGTLRFLNEACKQKYGVTDRDVAGMSYLSFVHPDDAPRARDALRTLAPGARFRRQSRGRTPAGWRWIDWEVSAITDPSETGIEIQGVGHDVTEQRAADEALQRTLTDLREREEQLRLMALRQVAIREEERKRLGFDLHDGVCQELVGIGILLESARQWVPPGPGRVGLERAQGYLGRVGEHLRQLARDLRPLQLPDLGLAESLRALAAGMARNGTRIATTFVGAIPRLGEDTEVAVYRVAQEALTNAVRHAGARTITLTLGVRDRRLRLEVRDDGSGFDRRRLHTRAHGLVAMEERATALGGTLRTTSARGAGTLVCLDCPVRTVQPQSAA